MRGKGFCRLVGYFFFLRTMKGGEGKCPREEVDTDYVASSSRETEEGDYVLIRQDTGETTKRQKDV